MPDYTARAAEVFQEVQGFVRWSQADAQGYYSELAKTLSPAQNAALTEDAGKERKQFLDRTSEYFASRNRRLDTVIASVEAIWRAALNRESADPQSKWKEGVDPILEDGRRLLGSILDGINSPTPKAAELKTRIQKEEEAFFGRLLELRSVSCWSRIGKYGRDLKDMHKSLDERWSALKQKMDEIDRESMRYAASLAATLDRHASWTADFESRLKRQLEGCASELKRLASDTSGGTKIERIKDGIDAALVNVNAALNVTADCLPQLDSAADSASRDIVTLRNMLRAQLDGIQRPFLDIRNETIVFNRESPNDWAKAMYNESKNWLEAWPSGATTGQQGDAERLKVDILAKLMPVMEAIEQDYREFERRHMGTFFGTLKDEVVQTFSRRDQWQREWERIKPKTVAGAIYDDLKQTFASALDSPWQSLIAALNERWKLDDVAPREALVKDAQYKWSDLQSRIRDRSDSVKRSAERFDANFRSSEPAQIFSRGEVEAGLR